MIPQSWSELPRQLLLQIFEFLRLTDAFRAGLTCRPWYSVFNSPELWKLVDLNFIRGTGDRKLLRAIEIYGDCMEILVLRLDQGDEENRKLGVAAIQMIGKCENRRVERFRLEFTGENPLFYAGQEFFVEFRK